MMAQRIPFEPIADIWEPPDELIDLISDKLLLQRDRVELIIAFYSSEHGGNAPKYEEIAQILGTSRGNAYKFAMELTYGEHPRARKMHNQFWLINSQYTHPVIKSRFAGVLHKS